MSIFDANYRPGLSPSDIIERAFTVRFNQQANTYEVVRLLKNGSVKVFNTYKTENGARNRCGHRNRGLKEQQS